MGRTKTKASDPVLNSSSTSAPANKRPTERTNEQLNQQRAPYAETMRVRLSTNNGTTTKDLGEEEIYRYNSGGGGGGGGDDNNKTVFATHPLPGLLEIKPQPFE